MFIVWGTQHAGKVDQVGEMFHVVTNFGHLYYIPLLPLGSFVVTGKNPDGTFNGAAIPLSFKSIMVGWLRAACVVSMIAATALLLIYFAEGPKLKRGPDWILFLTVLITASIVLWLSYRLRFINHASYERALALSKQLALNDVAQLMIEIHYGRLTAAQADEELARREELYELTATTSDFPVQPT
jgi:uncharacterized membrane protein (UPF0136 family)